MVDKKRKYAAYGLAAVLAASILCGGCGEGTGKAEPKKKDSSAEVHAVSKDSVKVEEPHIRDDIREEMDKAKRIANPNFIIDSDGGWYLNRDSGRYRKELYCYYGKEITQLYSEGTLETVFAVMEDGSIYKSGELLSDEYKIKEICNGGRYALTEDGGVLCLDKLEDGEQYHGIMAGINGLFLDKDGGAYGEGNFQKLYQQSGEKWKNTVLLDYEVEGGKDGITITGLSADGQVHAIGKYAEEILSWGELSYLSMGSHTDDGIIAGLTKEGKLKLTGSLKDLYQSAGLEGLEDIVAVKVTKDYPNMVVVSKDGTIRCIQTDPGDDEIWISNISSQGINLSQWIQEGVSRLDDVNNNKALHQKMYKKLYEDFYYIDAFGEMFKASEDEKFKASNSISPAKRNDKEYVKNLYIKALEQRKKERWGNAVSYSLVDLDYDGIEEAFIRNEDTGNIMLADLYDGELDAETLPSETVCGYWPKSGIIMQKEESDKGHDTY